MDCLVVSTRMNCVAVVSALIYCHAVVSALLKFAVLPVEDSLIPPISSTSCDLVMCFFTQDGLSEQMMNVITDVLARLDCITYATTNSVVL